MSITVSRSSLVWPSDQGQGEGGQEPWTGAHGRGGGEGGAQVLAGQHPQRHTDALLLVLMLVSPADRRRGVSHHGIRERGDVQVSPAPGYHTHVCTVLCMIDADSSDTVHECTAVENFRK